MSVDAEDLQTMMVEIGLGQLPQTSSLRPLNAEQMTAWSRIQRQMEEMPVGQYVDFTPEFHDVRGFDPDAPVVRQTAGPREEDLI